MLDNYQKYNPMRHPRWRSERALQLVDHRPRALRPKRYDDTYVRQYRDFLMKYLKAETDEDRLAMFPKHPAIYYAYMIDRDSDREWRTIIESRIMSGEDDIAIAARTSTISDTIFWYEKLFFNIRDRFHCRDWIVKTILGTASERVAGRDGTLTPIQKELVYKLFAYYGGPMVLDVVVSGFDSRNLPVKSAQIPGWFDNTIKTLLRSSAASAARVFEVNRYNIMQLFEIHLGVINAEQTDPRNKDADSDTPIKQNIEALLNGIPWDLAERSRTKIVDPRKDYVLSQVEPRATEQLQLASGVVPSNLASDHDSIGDVFAPKATVREQT